MTKNEFEREGFTHEILPSGYLNVYNKEPFTLNGSTTICSWSGRYFRTTNYKSLDELLKTVRLETIELSSVRPSAPVKKKTKTVEPKKEDAFEPVTNQSLAEFLLTETEAPVKTRRKRKA